MEELKEVSFVLEQGEIMVNDGYETPVECKVLVFDLASKYAEVLAVGSDDEYPTVLLWATDSTLKLDESKKGQPTEIKLPEYKGWGILTASVSRYSLTVVLERKSMQEVKDGWYIVQDGGGWYWTCYDEGKFMLACSDEFKNKMLHHPKIIEEYNKWVEQGRTN